MALRTHRNCFLFLSKACVRTLQILAFAVFQGSSKPETNPFLDEQALGLGQASNPFIPDDIDNSCPAASGDTELNPFLSPRTPSQCPPDSARSSTAQDTGTQGSVGTRDVDEGIGVIALPTSVSGLLQTSLSFSEPEICSAFEQWVNAPEHSDWEDVEMVAVKLVPLLIRCCRGVAPVHECERLRRRLVGAVKLTCASFGRSIGFKKDMGRQTSSYICIFLYIHTVVPCYYCLSVLLQSLS